MSLLNRFTNILQNAVEALAPQASSLEEFSFHWRRITNYYIETTDEKVSFLAKNLAKKVRKNLTKNFSQKKFEKKIQKFSKKIWQKQFEKI